jgi:hypothetical protein
MLMVRDETARILDGLSLADSIPAEQLWEDPLYPAESKAPEAGPAAAPSEGGKR